MLLSPCKTCISTLSWLSAAVLNTSLLAVGIVVFRGINGVITPPSVSIPSERGVTSNRSTSLTSPCKTPACIAAPIATTSSGLTPLWGSFSNSSFTLSCTDGIRVIPPTNITSFISLAFIPASSIAFLHGSTVLDIKSSTNCSNFALVRLIAKCLGPEESAVIKGRLISLCITFDNSIFAFSAASFSLCNAMLSFFKSIPWSFLKSSIIQSIILWSKSSPPKCVSPLVAFTSKTPSPIWSIDTSKVPPPRS